MIKVVIADDQPIIRDGLKLIVEQDREVRVVGCAANGGEAAAICGELQPDVVLMDIVMPVCDGIEGTKLIKQKNRSVKIIILTTFNDPENIKKAMGNGADGYVLKDIDSEKLIFAIKGICSGLRVVDESVFNTVIGGSKQKGQENEIVKNNAASGGDVKNDPGDFGLTAREMDIIRMVVYGKTNKEIASTIYISEGTTRNMISMILSKLKLRDRTQLAVFAVKNNLV